MEEAKKKLKVYCETSFWSWLVSRPSTNPDHEVSAVRHEISSRFGNDPKRYIESIREMKRRAGEMGLSFIEYCRSNIGTDALLPVL